MVQTKLKFQCKDFNITQGRWVLEAHAWYITELIQQLHGFNNRYAGLE